MVSIPVSSAAVEPIRLPARPRLRPDLRHGLEVALRAGLGTLAIAGVASVVMPSATTVAAIVAAVTAIVFELSRVRVTIDRRLDELEADIAQTQPLIELGARLAPRRPLPPLRGYAIAPDFALLLTELVADERPRLVVETGSGASTLVIAYALEQLGGGHVIALEHDPAYARETRAEIARHGLTAYASVIDAPLEPIELGGKTYRWYSQQALDRIDGNIDLVVDDGPPRHAGTMLRYASLPVFAKRLSARGLFVLDVVGEEERTILERWRSELPMFDQQHLATKKGNVLIRRR
ncbi:MAG: hypothetical protein JWO36_6103 [Myxococcales bacterium]|nr:hypothetical protein [Myxococcales bacterium]